MGVIRGFLAANVFGKVAFIVLLAPYFVGEKSNNKSVMVAEVFNWLCFAMNDWGLYDVDIANDDNKLGFGVWRICGNQEPNPNCQDLDGWRLAWYGTFQGFVIFGFMGINIGLLCIILLLYVPRCIGNRDMALCCAVSCFTGAVCYVIGLIIFGVRFDETYDAGFDREILMTSFYFAILVAILALVAGICAIIGVRGGHQVGSSSSPTSDREKPGESGPASKQSYSKKDEEQGAGQQKS